MPWFFVAQVSQLENPGLKEPGYTSHCKSVRIFRFSHRSTAIFGYKLLTAALIIAITLASGHVALRSLSRQHKIWQISDAFADGVFLGLALFHLLPDAYFSLSGGTFVIVKLILLCLLGYSILFFSTRFEHRHSAWFLLAMLSLHATITGSVLGIAPSFGDFLLMTFAILAHKGFETFALMTGLSRYWPDRTKLQLALGVFTMMTPLGIILGGILQYHLASSPNGFWLSYLNAIAAGTLLFIGISHTHGHQHKTLKKYQELLITVGGMSLMALIAWWI